MTHCLLPLGMVSSPTSVAVALWPWWPSRTTTSGYFSQTFPGLCRMKLDHIDPATDLTNYFLMIISFSTRIICSLSVVNVSQSLKSSLLFAAFVYNVPLTSSGVPHNSPMDSSRLCPESQRPAKESSAVSDPLHC